MKVEITGNNIDITPGIRERIEGKFKKLEAKRNLDIIGRHASVTKRANGKHKVEAYATIAGGKVVASAEQEDLFGAIRRSTPCVVIYSTLFLSHLKHLWQ